MLIGTLLLAHFSLRDAQIRSIKDYSQMNRESAWIEHPVLKWVVGHDVALLTMCCNVQMLLEDEGTAHALLQKLQYINTSKEQMALAQAYERLATCHA